MKRVALEASLLCLFAAGFAPTQAAPTKSNGATAQLLGEWRGRSLCVTTTRPACTDETVVYRIRKDAAKTGDFLIDANKIVDGKELAMGELSCSFETTRQQLICPAGNGQWQFRWDGKQLVGGLLEDGGAFRFVHLTKQLP